MLRTYIRICHLYDMYCISKVCGQALKAHLSTVIYKSTDGRPQA